MIKRRKTALWRHVKLKVFFRTYFVWVAKKARFAGAPSPWENTLILQAIQTGAGFLLLDIRHGTLPAPASRKGRRYTHPAHEKFPDILAIAGNFRFPVVRMPERISPIWILRINSVRYKNQTRFMINPRIARNLLISAFTTMLLFSCNYNTTVSSDPKYSHTVSRELKTKRPLEVAVIDFQHASYDDRHEISEDCWGSTLGRIGSNHTVYFDRAVRKSGYNKTGLHYLEGHITFKGKVIPIYYSLNFPGNQDRCLGNFYNDFEFVESR
jgi:hypothetical protein